MKVFIRLIAVLLPLMAIVTLIAHFTNTHITFVSYLDRLSSSDLTFVNDAKSALNYLVDTVQHTDISADWTNIFTIAGSALAIPFVFVYFISTCLFALFGMVFLIIPM